MALFRGSLRKPGSNNHRDEEDGGMEQGPMEETKEECEREIMKALWHAFDMLDISKSGNVAVSQLKVRSFLVSLNIFSFFLF